MHKGVDTKRLGWCLLFTVCLTIVLFQIPIHNKVSFRIHKVLKTIVYNFQNILYIIIINVDWLYWSLLFVPFYAFYICIGEKLYMLKSHITILQQDVSGKTKFIEWQNKALTQMDSRLVDLRKEMDVLRRSNESFRREEETWRKSRETLKKRIREQQKIICCEQPIIREEVVNTTRQEILTVVKKNKSESNIKSKKIVDEEAQPDQPAQPKGQSTHKSLPSIVMETKKGSSPEWVRARQRLLERSKKLMKNRLCDYQKPEEDQVRLAKGREDFDTNLDEMAACLATVSESETEENVTHPCRKPSDLNKRSVPKTSSELSVPTHHLEPIHHSRSSDPINNSFTAPTVPGYEIGEFGESKVKSYTEVFKRKVHVPTGGSGPRITIEGQRRWCF